MKHGDWMAIVEAIGPGFAAGADERDARDEFVAAHYPVLKERGLLTAMIPSALGGGGARHSTVAMMLRRLAYYDGSTALALSMHQHLVAAQVFNHLQGRPAPLLPRTVAEQLVLVSTGARDWLESNGTMHAVPGGYRVSARKAFASGSPVGDVLVTSAPFESPGAGWEVLHFAVPMHAEGVRLAGDWLTHGMRSTGSETVVLEDVFVPDAAISLRRPRGEYHNVWNIVLTVAMPLIAGVYVGIAERAAEIAISLARRKAEDPAVQWAAGEMSSALVVARVLHERMVDLAHDLEFEPSVDLSNEILVLKTQAVESARRVVQSAVEAAGGPAFYRPTGLERLLRDVSAGHFHPLPPKQQLQFTGRLALGLPPIEARAEERREAVAVAS
jgi:acyl-CoA dehydrogenase